MSPHQTRDVFHEDRVHPDFRFDTRRNILVEKEACFRDRQSSGWGSGRPDVSGSFLRKKGKFTFTVESPIVEYRPSQYLSLFSPTGGRPTEVYLQSSSFPSSATPTSFLRKGIQVKRYSHLKPVRGVGSGTPTGPRETICNWSHARGG